MKIITGTDSNALATMPKPLRAEMQDCRCERYLAPLVVHRPQLGNAQHRGATVVILCRPCTERALPSGDGVL